MHRLMSHPHGAHVVHRACSALFSVGMGAPVSVPVGLGVDMAALLAEAVAGGWLTAGSLDVAVCSPTSWTACMRVMTWRTRSCCQWALKRGVRLFWWLWAVALARCACDCGSGPCCCLFLLPVGLDAVGQWPLDWRGVRLIF